MYQHVLGGIQAEPFKKFQKLSAQAFNILRKHGNMIMTLFVLMLATGIPELQTVDDVLWLRKCLALHLNEEAATALFYEKITQAATNTRAMINDLVHIVAHNGLNAKK